MRVASGVNHARGESWVIIFEGEKRGLEGLIVAFLRSTEGSSGIEADGG